MRIVGCDPGLTAFGVAVADVDPATLKLTFLRLSVIRTAKSSLKQVRGFDDLSNRCRELFTGLLAAVDPLNRESPVVAICIEACALPFGKTKLSTVSALGRVRGLIDAVSANWRIPVVEETPQEVKRRLTGSRKASKEEMLAALVGAHPETRCLLPPQTSLHEHAADAAAVIRAGLQSDVVRIAIRYDQERSP